MVRIVSALLAGGITVPLAAQPHPQIPLRAGLNVVTAIANPDADYETMHLVAAADSELITLKVIFPPKSHRNSKSQPGASGDPQLLTAVRAVRRTDLATARHYMLQFNNRHPPVFPGTTALGPSSAVLRDLKSRGASTFHLGIPRGAVIDPRFQDLTALGRRSFLLRRVEPDPVMLPVIVNNTRIELPAIHARGRVNGVQADFWFLDDLDNPLSLKWQIGEQHYLVTAISFPNPRRGEWIVRSLADSGRVDVYGIYFDVGSAVIKPESEPVLQDIAAALKGNPGWSVAIEGHTDSVGGARYNLELSRARAAAVRDALVKHGVGATRMRTAGYGLTRPKESNSTLEGRALNRRVELVRRSG